MLKCSQTLDFTPQTGWVRAAAAVGQSHVTFNQRTLAVIGCELNQTQIWAQKLLNAGIVLLEMFWHYWHRKFSPKSKLHIYLFIHPSLIPHATLLFILFLFFFLSFHWRVDRRLLVTWRYSWCSTYCPLLYRRGQTSKQTGIFLERLKTRENI